MKMRNSSIELLRLILMFVILLFHVIGHGSSIMTEGINAFKINNTVDLWKITSYSFLYFPVDCFVIISGYFGIKFRKAKIVELWLSLLLVSITISLVFFLFKVADVSLIKALLPLRYDIWWFMTNYFMLCLLSPVLNKVDEFNIKSPKLFLGTLICFDFIFHNALANFIICYLIGKTLKRIIFSRKEIYGMIVFAVILHLLIVILLTKKESAHIFLLLSNYSPIIIIQAILVFLLFNNNLNFSSRVINLISSVSIYVYLITDHPLVRQKIVSYINEAARRFDFIKILVFSILLFICSLIIGGGYKIFLFLMTKIIKKVSSNLHEKKF